MNVQYKIKFFQPAHDEPALTLPLMGLISRPSKPAPRSREAEAAQEGALNRITGD